MRLFSSNVLGSIALISAKTPPGESQEDKSFGSMRTGSENCVPQENGKNSIILVDAKKIPFLSEKSDSIFDEGARCPYHLFKGKPQFIRRSKHG